MKLFFIFFILLNIHLLADEAIDSFDSFEDEFNQKTEGDFDPLSGYNEVMTDINHVIYTKALFPISRTYAVYVDKDVRVGVSNIFYNIMFIKRFINNLLQGKLKNTLDETIRFGVNSTIGILGFYDPASEWLKLQKHDEDFGQTLGFYGVGGGFHIVIPILGPSNLRDALSIMPDASFDPINYLDSKEAFEIKSFYYVNENTFSADEYESFTKDAINIYPLLKEAYEQHRESEIKR